MESMERINTLLNMIDEKARVDILRQLESKVNSEKIEKMRCQIKNDGVVFMTSEDILNQLGLLRMACDVEQGELAKLMGWKSQATLSHWETGKRKLKIETLIDYAEKLGFSLHFVFKTQNR